MTTLVLASGSPRRLDLLRSIGLDPVVRPADLDESVLPGETPTVYVERLAREKAAAIAGPVVLAADTTVAIGGDILGKPADRADAAAMLRRLSGRTHHVHTGVAVRAAGEMASIVVTSAVHFAALTDAELAWYLDLSEPYDKAGSYALQGAGAVFVRAVQGSTSGIIGLPLAETTALLRAAGVTVAGDVGGVPLAGD